MPRQKKIEFSEEKPSTSNYFENARASHVLLDSVKDTKELEQLVFGGEDEFLRNIEKEEKEDESSDDEKPEEIKIQKIDSVSTVKKPAWIDEDDSVQIKIRQSRKILRVTGGEGGQVVQGDQYVNRLKQQYEKSVGIPTPKWADVKKVKKRKRADSNEDSESDNDEDDLTRRTGNFIGKSITLPKETLHFKRVCDVTAFHRVKAAINATEFHKNAQVLLVSGYTQRAMLFQIDNKENPLLQTVLFDKYPIETAHFSADGERVIVASTMHTCFYYYDMMADKVVKVPRIRTLGQQKLGRFCVSPDGSLLAFGGPNGKCHLLSATTYDYLGSLKMNGNVGAMCFSSSGRHFYSHGDDGEVYVWDVRQRDCIHKFHDDGCVKGTSVAVSPNDTFLACGSDSGVINLYDLIPVTNDANPKPLKSIMSLATSVNCLRFNCTNEILASCSNDKINSVRLFHIASNSTFQNFPNKGEKLRNVCSLDFSPNGGYFCCGNDNGQAFLYRLFQYENY